MSDVVLLLIVFQSHSKDNTARRDENDNKTQTRLFEL